MRKIKYIFSALMLLLLCGCAGNEVSANNTTIYASSIKFIESNISCYVGDSINISDVGLKIEPKNTTVKPTFSLSNSEIAKIEDNNIQIIKNGTVILAAEIEVGVGLFKKCELTIIATNKPVYANSINFENKNIILNLDETATNNFTLLPQNCTEEVAVIYIKGNIVNYDVKTKLITPINEGTDTVTIKVKCDENVFVSDAFNITVTNNIYAENLSVDVNNLTDLIFFVNEEYKLNINVSPVSYNKEIEIFDNGNLLNFSENNNFVVKNIAGKGNIIVKVKTSETEFLTKTISYEVINPVNELSVELIENSFSKFYSNIEYIAKINTSNINYEDVTFENCQFEYMQDNLFKIKFLNAGLISLKANYTYNGSFSNKTINFNKQFNVYNEINDINFSLTNGDYEIIPINNEYKLYMLNNEYEMEAIVDHKYSCAYVNAQAKGLIIDQSDLTFEIIGESVVLENNKIIATKVGYSTIKFTTNSPNPIVKEYKVLVESVEPTDIIVSTTEINLILNSNNESDKTYELNYNVIPKYAIYDKVIESVNNSNVLYNNGVVTAHSFGQSVITLTLGKIEKEINVFVNLIPNKLSIEINGINFNENNSLSVFVGERICVNPKLFYNETLVKNLESIVLEGNLVKGGSDNGKLYFDVISAGEEKITFKHENLSFSINLISKIENNVKEIKFENNATDINYFLTKSFNLNYTVVGNISNVEVTDEISIISSAENVATIENNNLVTLHGVGTTKIMAVVNGSIKAEFLLNVYNKEYTIIDSVNKLAKITNGSYLVTCDFDLSNFETINSFSGEIDFNNHSITNVKNSLFNTIETSGIVKNITILGNINFVNEVSDGTAVIAKTNKGTISNVNVLNVNFNFETSLKHIASVVYNNFGVVDNVAFNNVKINELRETITKSKSKAGGVAFSNYGTIKNVTGDLSINNVLHFGGITNNNFSKILNVNLKLNIIAADDSSFGGISFKDGFNGSENLYEDVLVEINVSGSNNISFGGIVNYAANAIRFINVFSKVVSLNSLSSSVGLFINNISANYENSIVAIDSGYYALDNFTAIEIGTINNLIIK